MYLQGSKWNMQHRQHRFNWFLIILLVLLILVVAYLDRFIIPTVQTPFLPTPTQTVNPASLVSEAQGLFANGKFLQAIDVYQQAILAQPDNADLYIAQAQVQVYAGLYDDAITSAENALLLQPNNAMAYAVRGWAYDQEGSDDFTQADDSIRQALQLDPTNGIIHAYYTFLLGDMFSDQIGPYTDPITLAIAESKTCLNLAPNSLEAHWARGYVLYLTSNYEQALTEYQAAISLNGNISELHLDLGVDYMAIGSIDDAIQQYTLAKTLNPSDDRPDLYSSRAQASVGNYAQAAQYAQNAVTTDPTDPYLRGNWGYMLYKVPDWSSAAVQLALAVSGGKNENGQMVKPDPLTDDDWTASYYYIYDLLLARLGRCAEALPLAQTILTTVPDNQDAVYNANFVIDQCSSTTPVAGSTSSAPQAATP
jgi:tetratricopeptide (TPR) repeat protein